MRDQARKYVLSAGLAALLAGAAFSAPAVKTVVRPGGPPKPSDAGPPARGPLFNPGILVGDTLYLAGQGAKDKTGQFPEGFPAQVRQAMDNAGAVLKAAKMGWEHVVNANVYLTDIGNFEAMNAVYRTYFKSAPPARTTIAVPALPGTSPVEVTFIASRRPKKVILPKKVKPNPALPFSLGIQVGDTLYLAGQASRNLITGEIPPAGDFPAHVKQTLENLRLVLEAAGMKPSQIASANVYLTDMANFQPMNEVYRGFFEADPPARTTVGVPALPGGLPVEITFLASRAPRKIVRPEGSKPSPNFSDGVLTGGMLHPAGKAGSVPGIEAQTREVLDGLGATLKAAGRGFSDVVEAKVYLKDIKDYDAMNGVFRTYFQQEPPARSCVAISGLVGTAAVEVTLVVAAP